MRIRRTSGLGSRALKLHVYFNSAAVCMALSCEPMPLEALMEVDIHELMRKAELPNVATGNICMTSLEIGAGTAADVTQKVTRRHLRTVKGLLHMTHPHRSTDPCQPTYLTSPTLHKCLLRKNASPRRR